MGHMGNTTYLAWESTTFGSCVMTFHVKCLLKDSSSLRHFSSNDLHTLCFYYQIKKNSIRYTFYYVWRPSEHSVRVLARLFGSVAVRLGERIWKLPHVAPWLIYTVFLFRDLQSCAMLYKVSYKFSWQDLL